VSGSDESRYARSRHYDRRLADNEKPDDVRWHSLKYAKSLAAGTTMKRIGIDVFVSKWRFEAGQTVIPHGPDRELTVEEARPRELA